MQAKQMFPTYVFAKVQRDRVPQVVEELRKLKKLPALHDAVVLQVSSTSS